MLKVNGMPFFSVGAQFQNASTYDQNDMEYGFKAAKALKLNTVAVPFYWEAIEPAEGVYDFSSVLRVILKCRKENIKLALVWFGTWKDASMSYTPLWIKQDRKRFRRAVTHDGVETAVLSPYCEETKKAAVRVFRKLAAFVANVDSVQQTVIGIQAENEPGLLGAERDWCEAADEQIASEVPDAVFEALEKYPDTPAAKEWKKLGGIRKGNWLDCFGPNGNEAATSYAVASFIDAMVEAAKEEYSAVPYYINAALDTEFGMPGIDYIAGGPHRYGFPFYKAAAKHVDFLTPDLYSGEYNYFFETLSVYNQPDNELVISETAPLGDVSRWVFEAIEKMPLAGIHIFGLETMSSGDGVIRDEHKAMAKTMRMLSNASPLIESGLPAKALCEKPNVREERIPYAGYLLRIAYGAPKRGYGLFSNCDYLHYDYQGDGYGRGLMFEVNDHEFYLVGENVRVYFDAPQAVTGQIRLDQVTEKIETRSIEYATVEEGYFDKKGRYVPTRLRNGDERDFGIWLTEDVGVVHVVMAK